MTPKPAQDKLAGKGKKPKLLMTTYRMVARVSQEKSFKARHLFSDGKEQIRWENGFCAGALWMWRRLKK